MTAPLFRTTRRIEFADLEKVDGSHEALGMELGMIPRVERRSRIIPQNGIFEDLLRSREVHFGEARQDTRQVSMPDISCCPAQQCEITRIGDLVESLGQPSH